jgi:hypothetical protein
VLGLVFAPLAERVLARAPQLYSSTQSPHLPPLGTR